MNKDITKIREALFSLYVNMLNFNVIYIKSDKVGCEGEFYVGLFSGVTKKVRICYNNKTDELKIEELPLNKE